VHAKRNDPRDLLSVLPWVILGETDKPQDRTWGRRQTILFRFALPQSEGKFVLNENFKLFEIICARNRSLRSDIKTARMFTPSSTPAYALLFAL
jgi:hypothetical protein